MPILETPPNASTQVPPPPLPDAPRGGKTPVGNPPFGKLQTRQFGELDHTELVRLLDTLDDERSKARFRESIYISLFFWIGVVAFLIFAPRYFPHSPRFVTPSTETKDHQITSLTLPPDVQRALDHAPRSRSAPKAPATATPQLQQPAPAAPAPKAPTQPQTQPAPRAAAPPSPPPVVQQSPLPTPRSAPQQNIAALPSAPAPSPTATRPNFGNPNPSAHDMVRQAGQGPRGGGLDDGPGIGRGRGGLGAGVELLTDTGGVDFDQYLKKVIAEIKTTWEPLIPEEARPPLNKQGETQIRFIILADGRIGGMVLEGSTHDDAINKSCWGSITGVGQFPPLPSQFHGPNIELRVHYLVNKDPQ